MFTCPPLINGTSYKRLPADMRSVVCSETPAHPEKAAYICRSFDKRSNRVLDPSNGQKPRVLLRHSASREFYANVARTTTHTTCKVNMPPHASRAPKQRKRECRQKPIRNILKVMYVRIMETHAHTHQIATRHPNHP